MCETCRRLTSAAATAGDLGAAGVAATADATAVAAAAEATAESAAFAGRLRASGGRLLDFYA